VHDTIEPTVGEGAEVPTAGCVRHRTQPRQLQAGCVQHPGVQADVHDQDRVLATDLVEIIASQLDTTVAPERVVAEADDPLARSGLGGASTQRALQGAGICDESGGEIHLQRLLGGDSRILMCVVENQESQSRRRSHVRPRQEIGRAARRGCRS
jgi:hypothetical protein